MDTQPDIAVIASLIGEPARAMILTALLGGVALPASELASRCRLTQQTVSAHLAKLVAGGLLAVEPQGRHRYYRLANAEVGHALETFQVIAPHRPVRSLRQSEEDKALGFARTCYDHLAGRLGVEITRAMVRRGYLAEAKKSYLLTTDGEQWFIHIGIDVLEVRRKRRAFAIPCLDWSERQYHLAGGLARVLPLVYSNKDGSRDHQSTVLSVSQRLVEAVFCESLTFSSRNNVMRMGNPLYFQ